MKEPPGAARARVALTGLTVAEYFRDQEGQDVLLFIDNIFRWAIIRVIGWALIRGMMADMMIYVGNELVLYTSSEKIFS